jgi:hypothetical protein
MTFVKEGLTGRLERGRHLEIKLPVSGVEGGLACPPWLRVILSGAKDLSLERWILHRPYDWQAIIPKNLSMRQILIIFYSYVYLYRNNHALHQ